MPRKVKPSLVPEIIEREIAWDYVEREGTDIRFDRSGRSFWLRSLVSMGWHAEGVSGADLVKLLADMGFVCTKVSEGFYSLDSTTEAQRVAEQLRDPIIAAVQCYAQDHYEEGWDIVLETMDRDDIELVVWRANTPTGAIRKMYELVKPYADRKNDIVNA